MNTGNKWVATVASIWIQCTGGSSYAFGIYSPVLKSSQNYDQSTLESIAVFKDIGANAGLLSGILYSAVAIPSSPSHSSSSSSSSPSSSYYGIGGPWVVHAAGAIQCFIGYFFMWLSVIGFIPRSPVPLMCFFMFLAAHAQTFFNTANVVTGVQNFPDYSGTIVGVMKGFLGLSGAILIQVYDTIFEGNPSSFLLMLALLPTIVPFILMSLVRIYHTNTGNDKKHLNDFSVIALVTAAYLMVIIILENIVSLKLWARILTFIVLLLLLASHLSIAIRAQLRDSQSLVQTSSLERTRDPVGYHEVPSDVDKKLITNDKKKILGEEDLNLLQAMRTGNFWMLFIAMACGMGSGLATVNNISQIGGSLGYSSVETSTLVSLWSIWNFLGRFVAGYVSDYFLHLRGWSRPLFMIITLASMSIGHVVIASGLPGALYAGSVLVGVCYGSQWSLMPTITSEIFGVRHMGTIFNTISIASPVGSYILSVRVVGYIYDKETSAGGSRCSGTHCFMLSFFIMASVTLMGSVVAFGLFLRTRKFYKLVICRRLQHFASHEEGI
ncbi:protein NUCLEAR FUSION DEFECTIVE 4-like isoform X2 [Telopea speciosissima]|uniref:protein NUCLEAR FUSION DEFECTIVE 4-like isoform X2 n=1 Tax=Telopea speciosissima TaxID=54955 RepID=UPI001CC4F484|nr:protein NUCLEAR FUSION DEFECTIVE 4-like isoform X2 [Telopea speciosissima]